MSNDFTKTKVCTKCKNEFPATRDFFYADPRLSDGLFNACKWCHSKMTNGSITRTSHKLMLQRCHNPNCNRYRWYGAKGVQVCSRWRGTEGFTNFVQDMGERPGGTTLGRLMDTGNYCKENCKWMTRKEQGIEQAKKRHSKKELVLA